MASEFSLRCYCYLDRMQPQYAAFVGTITQGDLPVEGMASLYIEMAPGNEVFRTVDIAVKATEAQPGAQVVELGPVNESIHKIDENINIRELDQLTEIYLEILKRLLA